MMEPYQQRVVDEAVALKDKLTKLTGFFHSDKFGDLSEDERVDMSSQEHHMEAYLAILERRIKRFG